MTNTILLLKMCPFVRKYKLLQKKEKYVQVTLLESIRKYKSLQWRVNKSHFVKSYKSLQICLLIIFSLYLAPIIRFVLIHVRNSNYYVTL